MSKSKTKTVAEATVQAKVSEAAPRFLVKLSQLVVSAQNVRRFNSEAGIDELMADLSAHGLIQNLRVREQENGKFAVVAGSRRFRALKELAKAGGSIKGRKVTASYPVAVSYQEADDDDAEISLAENFQRVNMHPADEAQAFLELTEKEGQTPEQIADRFGVSHMTVRRRLKLAKVSPKLVDAFRAGDVTLEQMEALAFADDHEQQEAAFFGVADWQRNPRELRQRLSSKAIAITSPIARFVTVEAYQAAGGELIRDLFATDSLTFMADRVLVYELANARLGPLVKAAQAEGWKWAEVATGWLGNALVTPKSVSDAYSEEDQALIEALDAEDEALSIRWDASEGEEDDQLQAELEALQASIHQRRNEVEDRYLAYDPDAMKFAGVALRIVADGSIEYSRGIVKSVDIAAFNAWQAGEPETPTEEDEDEDEDDQGSVPADVEDTGPAYTMAVVEDLTAYKTAVLAVELAKRPNVALVVAVHALALDHFKHGKYLSGYHYEPACRLRDSSAHMRIEKPDPDNQAALTENKKALAAWQARLPEDPSTLWAWLLEQRPNVVMDLFAYLVGQSLDVWRQRHQSSPRFAQGDQVAVALGLDMAKWWVPSTQFFERVPKAVAIAAVKETGQPEAVANGMVKDTKGDAVRTAVTALEGTGWLPAPLRVKATDAGEGEADEAEQEADDDADDAEANAEEAAADEADAGEAIAA